MFFSNILYITLHDLSTNFFFGHLFSFTSDFLIYQLDFSHKINLETEQLTYVNNKPMYVVIDSPYHVSIEKIIKNALKSTDDFFNPFHATGFFLYHLKTLENQRFLDVLREY